MEDKDLIIAKYKRRSQVMSVIAGVMLFFTFNATIYAFVQMGLADECKLESVRSFEMAQKSQREAELQRQAAASAMEQASRAHQQCQEALQKALKR
jgi:hypothetical protein